MPTSDSTVAMSILGGAKALYDFGLAVMYFMALIRSVHMITPLTFMILSVCQCGSSVMYLGGLIISPWCHGGNRSAVPYWSKYISYYVVSVFLELWLFSGTIYYYITYKDEIVGSPDPVNDPAAFSVLNWLFIYAFSMVCLLNIVRYYWLWMKLGMKAAKGELEAKMRPMGKRAPSSRF